MTKTIVFALCLIGFSCFAKEESDDAPSCHTGVQHEDEQKMVPVKTEPIVRERAPKNNNPSVVTDKFLPDGERVKTVLFPGFRINKIYPSMYGPWADRMLKPLNYEPSSRNLWILGYRAGVLDPKSGSASQEFMCHTNLDLLLYIDGQMRHFAELSISQGQKEISFPKGFALRLPNTLNGGLDLNVMVLNNGQPQIDRILDFKSTIRYMNDRSAESHHLKPLKQVAASIYCTVEPGGQHPTKQCEPASKEIWDYGDGSKLTGHWVVPPGRQVFTSNVTNELNLHYDTNLHYVWMHVHPYAKSITLKDKTNGKTIFTGKVEGDPEHRPIVKKTTSFKSEAGIHLYKNHHYELTAVYDNPTQHNTDAMASLWMYVDNKDL